MHAGTRLVGLLAAVLGLVSCQVTIPPPRPGYAHCQPCVEAGDLGCLEVRMDEAAVRLTEGDQTFWFCSVECRDQWLADRAR